MWNVSITGHNATAAAEGITAGREELPAFSGRSLERQEDFFFSEGSHRHHITVCSKVPRLRLFACAALVVLNHLRNWSEEEDENTRQGLRAGYRESAREKRAEEDTEIYMHAKLKVATLRLFPGHSGVGGD